MEESDERRLSAIISGDVVGYSRLMADDEADTIRRVNQYREEIELRVQQHQGRLVDFTGDNFLAEFSSSVRAVECAIEIQNVMHARNLTFPEERRMAFRLGVHMADLRVGDGRVYGTGVNVASRLEGLAEPGGICISAAVYDQFEGRLQVDFEDIGVRMVKNIPKPLHVYRVHPRLGDEPTASRRSSPRRVRGALLAGGVGVAVAAAAFVMLREQGETGRGATGFGTPGEASSPASAGDLDGDDDFDALLNEDPDERDYPALPDRPSIVVLPFQNMSDDPQQAYFADGIAEDLTTDLSKVPQMFVIARNSAFTYKGKAVDVSEVGRELGVRYVVEGSTRKAGDQVRVTAQLIDATTGFHVWSERYDREFSNVFALQTEITEQILHAVGVEIADAELQRIRRKPPENLTAYESALRGRSLIVRFNRKDQAAGRVLLERAIELDPNFAEAYALLAGAYMTEFLAWNTDPALSDLAEPLALRALELDPDSRDALQAMAAVHVGRGEVDPALGFARRAVEVAPNDFDSLATLGVSLLASREYEEAVEVLESAMRLNPRESGHGRTLIGMAYYQTGRTSEAVTAWEKVRAANPDAIGDRLALAGHAISVDDFEYARELVAEVLEANPEYSGQHAREWFDRGGVPAEDIDRLIEQLARAGLPRDSAGS